MGSIGSKIKNIRELKNYTQEFVADKLEMTQAGYSKIERGEVDVTYSKIEEIATVFEITAEELIGFDHQKFFNSFNNVKGNNVGSVYINEVSTEIKKLYDDKVSLLEKMLKLRKEQLARYQDKFGDI